MSGHKRFTVATNVQVYFCDPRSPWQRGSNENTNRLLRQYFPEADLRSPGHLWHSKRAKDAANTALGRVGSMSGLPLKAAV